MPIKIDKGWFVDFRPRGADSKRYRKTFSTKAEALRYKNHILSNYTDDWNKQRKDTRRMSELLDYWFLHFGQSLKTGLEMRRSLGNVIKLLGNPVCSSLSTTRLVSYRAERLEKGLSKNSINREFAYLKSFYNELIRSKEYFGVNPLSEIKQLKITETELTYLTMLQMSELLDELDKSKNKSVKFVSLICLSTGCRWSEAEKLSRENVLNGKVMFTDTKSGKNRAVPVNFKLLNSLPQEGGRLFVSCYAAFKEAISRCSFTLPPGQLTHVLRHTFASHFMMEGGNIIVLQRILGHANLTMTMRYSHFSPDHLEDAIKYNPLTKL